MEVASSPASKYYKPFPHRDPYGLDTMYISPLEPGEIWDLGLFVKPDLLCFSFLVLRSLAYREVFGNSFPLKNTGLEFRKAIGKKSWNLDLLPAEWKGLFPQMLSLATPERGNLRETMGEEWREEERGECLGGLSFDSLPVRSGLHWEEKGEIVGFGFLEENTDEVFPKILDRLLLENPGRVYLRTSRQSFLYLPQVGELSKKGLFIQDREKWNFPEFFYYWVTTIEKR